jgi:hypothetical protein
MKFEAVAAVKLSVVMWVGRLLPSSPGNVPLLSSVLESTVLERLGTAQVKFLRLSLGFAEQDDNCLSRQNAFKNFAFYCEFEYFQKKCLLRRCVMETQRTHTEVQTCWGWDNLGA